MSQISKTSVLQDALRHLQEAPLMSPQDNRPVTRSLRDSYDTTVSALLRSSLWAFATQRAILNPDAGAILFGGGKRFALPGDCVTVHPVTSDGTLDGALVPYEVQGRHLYADVPGALILTYIASVTEDLWPADFAKAVAATLAAQVAQAVTSKVTYAQGLQQTAEGLLKQAEAADAAQRRVRFNNPILAQAYARLAGTAPVRESASMAYELMAQYPTVLRECLRLHPWNFATVRAELVADATRPAFGFRYRYPLPPGLLRLSQPTLDGVWQSPNVTYRVEGGWIVSDIGPRLRVVYVEARTDVGSFPEDFVAFASAHLCLKVVTGSPKAAAYQLLLKEREDALATARMNDSVQGTLEAPQADAWQDARLGYDAFGDSGRPFWSGTASNQPGGEW